MYCSLPLYSSVCPSSHCCMGFRISFRHNCFETYLGLDKSDMLRTMEANGPFDHSNPLRLSLKQHELRSPLPRSVINTSTLLALLQPSNLFFFPSKRTTSLGGFSEALALCSVAVSSVQLFCLVHPIIIRCYSSSSSVTLQYSKGTNFAQGSTPYSS